MIGPHTGEAVCLQFYAYRNRVGPPLVALRALGVRPLQDAELVLHMMTDLMGNHIGFGELPGRVEPVLHFLEKGQIEIRLLVFRTIEGPRGGTGEPACRAYTIGIEDEFWIIIGPTHALEELRPDILGVCEDDRDKLTHRIGPVRFRHARGTIAAVIRPTRLCLLLGLVLAQQCQQSAGINTEKQPHKHDNDGTDPADAHGKSTTHTRSVLDVLAFPIAYPTHRNTSGRILPLGKHNSTSLSPGSERRGLPTR